MAEDGKGKTLGRGLNALFDNGDETAAKVPASAAGSPTTIAIEDLYKTKSLVLSEPLHLAFLNFTHKTSQVSLVGGVPSR